MKRLIFLLSLLLAGASMASGQQIFLGAHFPGGGNGGCPIGILKMPSQYTVLGNQVANCGTVGMVVSGDLTVSPATVTGGTVTLVVPSNFTVSGSPIS